MNSMAISTKMIESDEYKDTRAALDYMLVMLRQQLVITKDIMEEYERLKSKGYQQYRTYAHNKRKDKITRIPMIPVQTHDLLILLHNIDTHFEWDKEHKNDI